MKIKTLIIYPLFVTASLLSAETLTYNNAASGSFYDSTYWGGTVPSATTDAVITGALTNTLTMDATSGVTLKSLNISTLVSGSTGYGVTVKLDSATFTILDELNLSYSNFYSGLSFTSTNGKGKLDIGSITIVRADGKDIEALLGTTTTALESIKVTNSITVNNNAKLRFATYDLKVGGKLILNSNNFNLFYCGQADKTVNASFGGLVGTNRAINLGCEATWITRTNKIVSNITLTNGYDKQTNTSSKWSGALKYIIADTNTESKTNIIMNASDSRGVQYIESTGTSYTFDNVTVKNGKMNYFSNLATTAITVQGGELSAATTSSEIATLKGSSLSWSGGILSFDIVEDTSASDKITLSGKLNKVELLGAPAREIDLVANSADVLAWIEASETGSITYTLMEYAKDSTIKNGDVNFLAINGVNIAYNFGDTALTVTLSKVPEPAMFAAIFGAIALAFVAYRRRK